MKARKVEGLRPDQALGDNAKRIVATRLEELRAFAPDALEPGGVTARHDMRIAAKRLRYALEVLGGCLGAAAEPARATAKELQGLLGELHDCDVMAPRAEGIDSVEALLRTRRELLYRRFVELWRGDETQDVLDRLSRVSLV
jgi:CHAD domain-containing protein